MEDEQIITLPEIIEVIEVVAAYTAKTVLKIYNETVKIPAQKEAIKRYHIYVTFLIIIH